MDLVWGAVDPRSGYISKILHVKTKESGPIGGVRAGRAPLDPPMQILREKIAIVITFTRWEQTLTFRRL